MNYYKITFSDGSEDVVRSELSIEELVDAFHENRVEYFSHMGSITIEETFIQELVIKDE